MTFGEEKFCKRSYEGEGEEVAAAILIGRKQFHSPFCASLHLKRTNDQ